MTRTYSKVLFAGTFNPFTIGHKSIVDRLLAMGESVVIGIGHNPDKPDMDLERRLAEIREVYRDEPRVEVAKYSGLTVDFAQACGADYMVRGVRNSADFEYERNLAEINLRISGVETLLMPSLPELGFVSSSMVRELQANGRDATEFIASKQLDKHS
ncbi:MAG: pantetheine-phosphate adenylyltransferase [Lepagella sp.]